MIATNLHLSRPGLDAPGFPPLGMSQQDHAGILAAG